MGFILMSIILSQIVMLYLHALLSTQSILTDVFYEYYGNACQSHIVRFSFCASTFCLEKN